MSAAEEFHVSEVSPSYWRVTFDNGPVSLRDLFTSRGSERGECLSDCG